jgi:hypothetical protein
LPTLSQGSAAAPAWRRNQRFVAQILGKNHGGVRIWPACRSPWSKTCLCHRVTHDAGRRKILRSVSPILVTPETTTAVKLGLGEAVA